ncbi:hypothetical protein [Micromonospora sp. WMMD1082]|uniref:hypothetical protein n=1 Tax=Micromonospora sp. WMMD1082 TaxID=3016104 RepID=UPI0024161EE8|nr:hypothetical protein [Micromonospora sp. WMMD1082]MDG4796830.1 hypothetical protein [Micromonospora sp. WMMD1082]
MTLRQGQARKQPARDDWAAQAGVPMSVAALHASLRLNQSECYRKLADLDRAREFLQRTGSARSTLTSAGNRSRTT